MHFCDAKLVIGQTFSKAHAQDLVKKAAYGTARF
jgi:hypothetical protein